MNVGYAARVPVRRTIPEEVKPVFSGAVVAARSTGDIHRIGGSSIENLRLIVNRRTIKLVDQSGNVVATARVAEDGEHYSGTIDLSRSPEGIRVLFEEFEEIVNGQMFSFLDEIQEKIDSLALAAVFDGREISVSELQIFPTTGDISFKAAEVPAPRTKSA